MADNIVFVPALENGVVAAVMIEQNAEVQEGQVLAILDDQDVRQHIKTAELVYEHSLRLAKDETRIQLAKSILKKITEHAPACKLN